MPPSSVVVTPTIATNTSAKIIAKMKLKAGPAAMTRIRILLYIGYTLCMVLAFVKPQASLYVILIFTAIHFVSLFIKKD